MTRRKAQAQPAVAAAEDIPGSDTKESWDTPEHWQKQNAKLLETGYTQDQIDAMTENPRAKAWRAAQLAAHAANDAASSDLPFPEQAEIDELARAVLEPLPTPPARRSPQPGPRRVSAEVVKAETKLVNLERRRQESLAHAERVWADKRVALIQGFPPDVHAALRAMGVLREDDPR